jgi:hypothetical protein
MQSFMHSSRINVTTVLMSSIFLAAFAGCGEGRATHAKRQLSLINMKQLILVILNYRDVHDNEWPENVAQVQSFRYGGLLLDMKNPLTGDEPGYEYVMPPKDADPEITVILYQLRDGQRDIDLQVGFGDGHFSEFGSTRESSSDDLPSRNTDDLRSRNLKYLTTPKSENIP